MNRQRMLEELYRIFVRESDEGIWIAELKVPLPAQTPKDKQMEHLFRHAIIAECNHVFAEMYGFRLPQELKGMPLLGFIDRSDPMNAETIQKFLKSGYKVSDVETHELDKDGNPRYFLNSARGIVDGDYLIGIVGVQREITEMKLVEKERSELISQLAPRQRIVLQLLVEGSSVKEVASALNVSVKTVETHRARVMRRLNIHDLSGLIQYGIRLGLVGSGQARMRV